MKKAAVAKGGRNRSTPKRLCTPTSRVKVAEINDVQALLFRTLQELRNGEIDAEMARAVGYVAGVTTKVHEAIGLEQRVHELECLTDKFDSVLEEQP